MAETTYPAREYLSGVPLCVMDRGGYQRRVHPTNGTVTWYFCLPVEAPVQSIADALVPTIKGKPVITIARWHLNQTTWIKLADKV